MHKFTLAALIGSLSFGGSAIAQTYATGQSVYATPTGVSNGWYSGCIVGSGRSNSSYQVECAGQTWWVSREHISLTPPRPEPDPMRPGHMLIPQITPSHAVAAAPARMTAVSARRPAVASGADGPGNYAAGMASRIAQDKADAANAVLATGKYSCYAGGRYTFSDLFINGPHSYTVKPGGSGSYSYAHGALTFTSGPYAGAYSRMVDGHTVGISAKGSTNLGTQCELSR